MFLNGVKFALLMREIGIRRQRILAIRRLNFVPLCMVLRGGIGLRSASSLRARLSFESNRIVVSVPLESERSDSIMGKHRNCSVSFHCFGMPI